MEFLEFLAQQARADRVAVTDALDEALIALDEWLQGIAAALEVEYYGPGVGVEGPDSIDAYRLVVRCHEWNRATKGWGLKICDGTEYGEWRPMWTPQAAGRRRKQAVVRALPAFFEGYAKAIEAAGRSQTESGQAVLDAARVFGRE